MRFAQGTKGVAVIAVTLFLGACVQTGVDNELPNRGEE
jgi:hypothetical protein